MNFIKKIWLGFCKYRHRRNKEKLENLRTNKEQIIYDEYKRLESKRDKETEKSQSYYAKKSVIFVESEINREKEVHFSNSTNLKNELDKLNSKVRSLENEMSSKQNNLSSKIRELSVLNSKVDNTLSEHQYNSLVNERYKLKGIIQRAQNSNRYRLSKSDYYSTINRINYLDSVINKAKASLKNKQRILDLSRAIPRIQSDISQISKELEKRRSLIRGEEDEYRRNFNHETESWNRKLSSLEREFKAKADEIYTAMFIKDKNKIDKKINDKRVRYKNYMENGIIKYESRMKKYAKRIEHLKNKEKTLAKEEKILVKDEKILGKEVNQLEAKVKSKRNKRSKVRLKKKK